MIPKLLKNSDYYKIGLDLGYAHREAYIKFMLEAFPKCRGLDYAAEWAERFRISTHWAASDKKRKAILRKVYCVNEE